MLFGTGLCNTGSMANLQDNTAHDRSLPDAEIYQLSESAIVLRARREYSAANPALDVQQRIWALDQFLRATSLPRIDIIPGLHNITVTFDGPAALAALWRNTLEAGWSESTHSASQPRAGGRQVELEVYYGGDYGPDLEAVCKHCALDPASVITLHSEARYTVAFIGFQPGFPYLLGLPEPLFCPRKPRPVQQLAAGSVAIGGQQTGIYPASSPGGWQVIGRLANPAELFSIEREEPALLQAADQLRFIPR